MCVFVYIYIYMYMYVCIYLHIYTYVDTCVYMYIYIYILIYVYVSIGRKGTAYTFISPSEEQYSPLMIQALEKANQKPAPELLEMVGGAYIRTSIHICIYKHWVYIYVYIYLYVCIYIFIRICIYVFMYIIWRKPIRNQLQSS
jgi:hypothetical protein